MSRQEQGLQTGEAGEVTGGETGIFPRFANPKKEALLMAIIETGGSIPRAAELIGMSKWAHYSWMRDDSEYAKAYEEIARPLVVDTLRAEVIRRGHDGYDEPIIYKGEITGKVRRYSDNLLMFETKRQDPLYRDNHGTQVGIMASGPVQVSFSEPEKDAARPNDPVDVTPQQGDQPVDNSP